MVVVEQFCEFPPEKKNSTLTIYRNQQVVEEGTNVLLWVNQSIANYSCEPGFAHISGTLEAQCIFSNTLNASCISEPVWNFPEGDPNCVGEYGKKF